MRTSILILLAAIAIGCGAKAGESIWIQKQPAPDGVGCYIAWQGDIVVGFSCVK